MEHLTETIMWCVANNVVVFFDVEDGILQANAAVGNILAPVPVVEPVNEESVTAAILTALASVEHGKTMMDTYGGFPPIPEGPRGPEENE